MAKLEDYAKTERQLEVVKEWERSDRNASRAAIKLAITPATVRNIVSGVKAYASAAGFSDAWDATAHVPDGEYVTGRSIYLEDDSGNKAWLKTRRKLETAEKEEALKAFVDQLNSQVKQAKKTPKPSAKGKSNDLLPTVIIGDSHIGMKADGKVTRGRDFDSKIASAEIIEAIDYLVDAAPAAEHAMLINVGDFTHIDRSIPYPQTANGTPMDSDSRIELIMRKAADTMIHGITRMLEKHSKVSVVMARGNHDSETAIAIAMILAYRYAKEPRVTILEPNGFFTYTTFGKNLIAITHGDKAPGRRLADMLPRLSVWSSTSHRYWILGHFHSKLSEQYDNSVVLERFGTLAPADFWHASKGYCSPSIMNQIVYRRSGGIAIRHEYEIPGTITSQITKSDIHSSIYCAKIGAKGFNVMAKDPRLTKYGLEGYNKPKKTPGHSTKSHVVLAKEGDDVKLIRFGQQGVKGSPPRKNESDADKARRASFKARHEKNIRKGKMSGAFWANKVKW